MVPSRSRRPVWLLAMALSSALLTATSPAAQAQVPAAPPPTAQEVTLITGDKVRVTPRRGLHDHVRFEPGPGSRSRSAVISFTGSRVSVVPTAAQPLVDSGRLDPSLFDVSTLLAERRKDGRTPVIVRHTGATRAALTSGRRSPLVGLRGNRVLTSLGAQAGTADPAFWASITTRRDIARVSLDRRVSVALEQSVPQIGAPAAWQRGLTGRGVKVAVLDTGIDAGHPDLTGRVAATANFSEAPDVTDRHGHGTHVAGTVAGTGAASDGRYRGVAPDATLLNGKVLDDNGSGSASGVIAGMEWAAAQGADVVNLSLGGRPSNGTDEVSLALNRISRATGALFVVAAGNCLGPEPATVTSPAAADDALAVGNLERDGALNPSSCRGPRLGDAAGKPELSAPGTDIVAPRAAGSSLGDPVGEHYMTLTGTSMATPHVAGTAALVAQANPDWTAPRLKAQLISTADPQQAPADEEGAGRVDADQSTSTGVTVDTGELELGLVQWPYPPNDAQRRDLTYRNPGTTTVTLDLSVEPATSAIQLSAGQVEVPAGGQVVVTVTTDRTADGPGNYAGRIRATPAGTDPLVTTVNWSAEPELHPLTVKGIGLDGKPVDLSYTVAALNGQPVYDKLTPMQDGSAILRLPPGRYQVIGTVLSPATDTRPQTFDLVASDELELASATHVTLDLRKTRPISIVPRDDGKVAPVDRTLSYLVRNASGQLTGGIQLDYGEVAARATAVAPSRPIRTGSSEMLLGTRLFTPLYRAELKDGPALPVHEFWNGPTFTGTRELNIADGGLATPQDLAGVRGKLALIRRTAEDQRHNGELVKLAEAAGATGAMVYTTDAAGDIAVSGSWDGLEPIEATIPAMRISRVTARSLLERLAAGPVTVRVQGEAEPKSLYDLAQSWPGQLRTVGRVEVGPEQLARVDDVFGAQAPGAEVYTARGAVTPFGSDFVGRSVARAAPYRLTSFVQAGDMRWSAGYAAYRPGGRHEFQAAEPHRTYRAGEWVTVRWIAPLQTSGLPDAPAEEYRQVRRREGELRFEVAQFQNGREYGQDSFEDSPTSLSIERNGESVATADWTRVGVEVPDGPARYRAKLDTQRTSTLWRYPARVRTTWDWVSQGGADEVMPLLFADLNLPQADPAGTVPAGSAVALSLRLRHQHGSKTATISKAKLELSYDGQNWQELSLQPVGDGKYLTKVVHPAAQAGKALSVRLVAEDQDGNRLEQELTAAYGIR